MTKVMVSERALIQRINRKLSKESKVLKTAREKSVGFQSTGRFYIIDDSRNLVATTDIKLEKLGRELKVLRPYEELANS